MIEVNSNAGINRVTEPNQVLSPNAGVYLTFYAVFTTNTHKVNVAATFDVPEGCPCGHWDEPSSRVLAHKAFQPFEWPPMTDQSPPYVDLKFRVQGQLLIHVIMKCYRARGDLTIQKYWTDEALVTLCTEEMLQEVQVQHSIFSGFDICSHTFEPGQRAYALGPNGTVVALSKPRSHVEVRKILWGSVDFHGHEADRLEYKFTDVANSMSVAANRLNVPPTWVVLSNISGPTCAQIIQSGRLSGAACQAPDQAMQFGQLAALHGAWFPDSTSKKDELERPPESRTVRTLGGDDSQNIHVIVDSKLFFMRRAVVAGEALAIGAHDATVQADAMILPPNMGFGMMILAAPEGADNPALAVDLPPLIYLGAQRQPDMALGNVASEPAEGHLFMQPAPVEKQTPLQLKGAVRHADAQEYATPLIAPAVDQRRDRGWTAPAVPAHRGMVFQDMTAISAPTTLTELMQRNLEVAHATAPAQTRIGQQFLSGTTVQELDEGGGDVHADNAAQQEELRSRIRHVRSNEEAQDKHRVACARHVEQMGLYVQGAVDRKEEDGYIAHVRSLLNESETRLIAAVSKVSEYTQQRELLERSLDELVAKVTEL